MAEQLKIDVVLKNFASKELAVLDKGIVGFTKRGVLGFKNFAKSVFSVKGLLAGLGVGLAVRGISRLFTETADAAAKIDDLSVSLGVSTEALSELEFAAKLSGSNLGNLETAFRTLQQGLGEFATTGRGVVRDVLDKLSPAFRQLVREGAPAEDVFKQVSREMKNLSAAERVFVTGRLFGRGNAGLIKLLTSDIDALTKQGHRLGLTITKEMAVAAGDFNDSLTIMGAHTQGLKQQLILGLLPALNEFLKFLIESDTKGRPAMLRLLADVTHAIGFVGQGLALLGAGVSKTIGTFKELFIETKILRLELEGLEAVSKLPLTIFDVVRIQNDLKKLREELAKTGDETEDSTEAWLELQDAVRSFIKTSRRGLRDQARDSEQGAASTKKAAKEIGDAFFGIDDAIGRIFASGNKKLGELFDVEAVRKYVISLGDVPGRLKIIEQAELDLAEARKAASDAAPTVEQTQAMFEATNAIAGAGRAFKDLGQASREWGVAANQAVHAVADSIADNVTDGLMDLIEGTKSAKEAFADMARGILKDIAQIIIKTLILKAVQGAFGATGFAAGGVVPGHIEPVRGHLARGGIVRRRGLFEIAEGGQAEAVIPLLNGTHIPTKDVSRGGRGGGGAPTIVINSYYTANFLDAAHEGQLLQRNAKLMATLVGNEIRQSPAIREAFRAA